MKFVNQIFKQGEKMRIIFICLLIVFTTNFAQDKMLYKDSTQPLEKRVSDLLSRLTTDEKLDLLGGTGFASLPIARLGIPELRMTDGPVGVRWGESTAFPVSIAMAATWNPQLTNGIGSAIGRETKGHARHVILGPCVNIARLPMGGRNFESFGEDPFLATRMAVQYIKGVQKENVAATVKHFAVNNQEHERMFVDVMVSERALHEIYFPAFKAAVQEADVLCVMSSYNKVNLHWASENDYLLINKLKNEWGFNGLVMSDWGAVHSVLPTALGGLDLEMPTGFFLNKKNLFNSMEEGIFTINKLDDKVRRLLTVIFKLGLMNQPEWKENLSLVNSKENRKAAYETSLESIVLLKNEENILPIKTDKVKTIAVIGSGAEFTRTGGGGSALVEPIKPVSALEGLKSRLPNSVKLEYAKGVELADHVDAIDSKWLFTDKTQKQNGLNAEYFPNMDLSGEPKLKRIDKNVNFDWKGDGPGSGFGEDYYSVRWTGYIKVPKTAEFKIQTLSDDGVRVWIDDQLIIQDWTNHAALVSTGVVKFEEGKLYKVKMEFYEAGGSAVAVLGWKYGEVNLMGEAIAKAKNADYVLVFAGTNHLAESEGFDRENLILPANQDQLIENIAAVNKNVVVVLHTGSPVLMEKWLGKVKGVVEMWFAGSEGGNAIADVLLGNYNPSGKLPITFPKRWEDCSAYGTYKTFPARTYYADDIYVGYRHFDKKEIEPLFPFGFGLSYTTFEYSNLAVSKNGDSFEIKFDIKNSGSIAGSEVAQLYLASTKSEIDKPIKELKGFAKVTLNPGETKSVNLSITEKDFSYFNEEKHSWKTDQGVYKVMISASSRDIKLKTEVEIK